MPWFTVACTALGALEKDARESSGSSFETTIARASYEDLLAAEVAGTPPRVRELHLVSNSRLVWSEDVDEVAEAYASVWCEMVRQATELGAADLVADNRLTEIST